VDTAHVAVELAEELGCRIEVGVWVPVSSPIGATHLLRVAECRMLEGETPRPGPDRKLISPTLHSIARA